MNEKRKVKHYLFLFLVQFLARPLLITYFSFIGIREKNSRHYRRLRDRQQNFIFALWHENMLVPLYRFRHQGVYVLVSQHFDGELIARVLHRFGFRTIRGSSTRGGDVALRRMKQVLLHSRSEIAITPDGPTGPRRKTKIGILKLASETGCPILPLGVSVTRYRRFQSWDRFLLPLPPCRACITYGEPIFLPPALNRSQLVEFGRVLEHSLNELDKQAAECLSR